MLIADLQKFQRMTGIHFTDQKLLREALTHKSYATEFNLKYDNQRLEFLGDAVVQIVLTKHLFHRYPGSSGGGSDENPFRAGESGYAGKVCTLDLSGKLSDAGARRDGIPRL